MLQPCTRTMRRSFPTCSGEFKMNLLAPIRPLIRPLRAFALALPIALSSLSPPVAASDATGVPPAGTYLRGGIGEEERAQMRGERDKYNLRLTFAQARSGNYLADVAVTIRKTGSAAVYGPYDDAGPWFYIRLDPGAYRVSATHGGATHSLTLRIGRSASERVLYWPAQ